MSDKEQRETAIRLALEIEQFGGPAYMNRVQDALLVRALRSFAQSESAALTKVRQLAEYIIQVRGGVLGGFPMLQDKADEMSRLAAEILLTLPEAPK